MADGSQRRRQAAPHPDLEAGGDVERAGDLGGRGHPRRRFRFSAAWNAVTHRVARQIDRERDNVDMADWIERPEASHELHNATGGDCGGVRAAPGWTD
jgi:hypothetical protein